MINHSGDNFDIYLKKKKKEENTIINGQNTNILIGLLQLSP